MHGGKRLGKRARRLIPKDDAAEHSHRRGGGAATGARDEIPPKWLDG
jgi:hypothetical protein